MKKYNIEYAENIGMAERCCMSLIAVLTSGSGACIADAIHVNNYGLS